MVFYRKYRSQTIDDLDNKAVRETLLNLLSREVPHAFLFTGPKGLGKTSSARIIAKVVNCERSASSSEKEKKLNATIEPCNQCEQCVTITNGTNLDVLEIDAASNRGIDEIRELRDKIRLAPLNAKKKVYIIDEVHMLTTEAFNALLKILEEPPSHAMFILCTTESHKIPSTILSRCFHIVFSPATTEELVRSFRRIVKGEQLQIDEEALLLIAKLSGGGFRDGTKLLEEVVALSSGEKITKVLVERVSRTAQSAGTVTKLLESLSKKEVKVGLEIIESAVREGKDIRFIISELQQKLHDMVLLQAGIGTRDSEIGEVKFSLEELKQLVALLNRVIGEMKYAVISQMPLELAVIEFCIGREEIEEKKKKRGIGNRESGIGEKSKDQIVVATVEGKDREKAAAVISQQSGVTVASLKKHVNNIAKIKALYGEETKETKETNRTNVLDLSLMHVSQEGPLTKEWLDTFWSCIINSMKTHNHTIAGVLRGCMLKSFDRKNLIIETSYKFHKEKLDEGKTMEALNSVCKELLGTPIGVAVVLKNN